MTEKAITTDICSILNWKETLYIRREGQKRTNNMRLWSAEGDEAQWYKGEKDILQSFNKCPTKGNRRIIS
jgi:hypothetical protein